MTTAVPAPPDDHPALSTVLGRVGRKDPTGLLRTFGRLLTTTEHQSAAVLANVVGLLAHQEPEDVRHLASLADELGAEALARLQLQMLRRLGDGSDRRWLGELVQRMVAGADDVGEIGLGAVGLEVAAHLVVEDVEVDPPDQARWMRTPHRLAAMKVDPGLGDPGPAEWRPFVAAILQDPWGRHDAEAAELATWLGHPRATEAVEQVVRVAREVVERRDRRQVADQVGRLVRASGLSQRDFAHRIGTSPSRLSTYVSGKVTPSAAMMVRITRTARTLERREDVRATA